VSALAKYNAERTERSVRAQTDAQARGLVVGARVKVAIRDRRAWNTDYADALDGRTGTIADVKVGYSNDDALALLVELDEPHAIGWSGSPIKAFWFEVGDLERAS
jgi:hypothetical protein